ncbi:MAG: CPBP family glutamic-type intramembrane protease [Planctomycetota bacterium]|nr:CPBP family glutamic-type intramembrane protease [Planctomycetota bacterium]
MGKDVGVYPNGMPHPSREVRRRLALELLALAGLTALYLMLMPQRALGVDVGMALVGLGLVGLYAWKTNEKIWGPPPQPAFERIPRCTFLMLVTTLPAVVLFLLYGAWDAYSVNGDWHDILYRLFRLNFFGALLLYVPWALLQQTLFQFYLLGRLRALLPFASPLLLSVINGVLYGLVHLPDAPVTAVTIIGGIVWSYSYHRDRYVLPLALSHAVLGSTFFYWVSDSDILSKIFTLE